LSRLLGFIDQESITYFHDILDEIFNRNPKMHQASRINGRVSMKWICCKCASHNDTRYRCMECGAWNTGDFVCLECGSLNDPDDGCEECGHQLCEDCEVLEEDMDYGESVYINPLDERALTRQEL
jgi:hypothetical protein